MSVNEEISHEQGADVRRIGQYVRNWWKSVIAGVEMADEHFCSGSVRSHTPVEHSVMYESTRRYLLGPATLP
jgi:hypothetical protein